MDGVKRGMTGSIQFRLSVVLCMAICIVALTSGGVAFFSALDEAHELQDATLTQIAALFKNQSHSLDNSNDLSQTLGSEEDSNVIVQIISRHKTDSSRVVPHFLLRQPLSVGFQTVPSPAGNYRVLVKTLSPDLQIAVAQKTVIRDEVAFDSAWRTLMSFSILLPILLLVVAVLIRKVFRPVTQLATDVSQRHEHDLTPLPSTDIPNEIRPFVAGINQLLGRVESSMAIQKRFIADAAHELRSPLTALSLQAERLSTVRMSTEAHERLSTLRQGINRTKRLLEQLLSLARAQQRILPTRPLSPVSVQSVYRHVIESLLPLALAKKIDLGVIDTVDEFIHVDEMDLFTVVKNLVENAVRYTPEGGYVDLRLYRNQDQVIIDIEDSGPGITEDKRIRVFDTFYRLEGTGETGSGLGLSIVQATVSRLGGKVALHSATHYPSGVRVTVSLPH